MGDSGRGTRDRRGTDAHPLPRTHRDCGRAGRGRGGHGGRRRDTGRGLPGCIGGIARIHQTDREAPHAYAWRLRSGTAALVGTQALVLERVDRDRGQVKIGGEVWTAGAFDEDDVFEPGARVDVMKIEGATALVAE